MALAYIDPLEEPFNSKQNLFYTSSPLLLVHDFENFLQNTRYHTSI